jgi:hypothetical protein
MLSFVNLTCQSCLVKEEQAKQERLRVQRKDEIDKATIRTANRQATKDAVDTTTKIAGVAVAGRALAWYAAMQLTPKGL